MQKIAKARGVEGNHGIPPVAMSVDNHMNFKKINLALLGLCSPAELANAPFWKSLAQCW